MQWGVTGNGGPRGSGARQIDLMRFRLNWICHSPSPYTAYLFRTLAADPAIDLTVHFTRPGITSHPWRSHLTEGYCSRVYRRAAGLDWGVLRVAAADRRSLLIAGSWNEPTIQLALTLRMIQRLPFVVWTSMPHLGRRRHRLKASVRSAWLRLVFWRAARVMGTGAPALASLEQMGCPVEKLVNLPHFVDLDAYRRPVPIPSDFDLSRPVKCISIGRIVNAIKGHDVAIAAFAKAQHLAGWEGFEYHLAGSGQDLAALQQRARDMGLGNRVRFLGWLEADQARELCRRSHVLVHPSRTDPYGAAVVEAMAAGLVVLGSDATGAVLDRIRHRENGFIHRSGDVDQLAEQIGNLILHPEILQDVGCRARLTAEQWPVERGVQTIKSILAETAVSEAGA